VQPRRAGGRKGARPTDLPKLGHVPQARKEDLSRDMVLSKCLYAPRLRPARPGTLRKRLWPDT
jgi:hypothetical protein